MSAPMPAVLTRVLVDAIVLFVTCAVFPFFYLSYRRTIRFRINDVRTRIQKTASEQTAQQAARLNQLAELKYQGYFFPLCYCTVIAFGGVLTALSKGGLVPCSVGTILNNCPWPPIAAFTGAYAFTLFDLIRRHRRMEMHADVVHRAWLRMLAGPLLAAAVTPVLADSLAVSTAFGLGVVPIGDLFTLIANRTRKGLGMEPVVAAAQGTGLGELQGVDADLIERFQNEGLTTVQQLAIGDTFATLLAVNVEWKTLLDYVDQAILHCYAGTAVPQLRLRGIRGAIELFELAQNLSSPAPNVQANARALVQDLASILKIPDVGALNLVQTVAADGQVEFIRALWEDAFSMDQVADPLPPSALSAWSASGSAHTIPSALAGAVAAPVVIKPVPTDPSGDGGSGTGKTPPADPAQENLR